MKTSPYIPWLAAAALLLAAGCASTYSRPRVNYPVTYQIQVGNSQVSAEGDRQNLNVVANQQVEVVPGDRLHFVVDSPVVVRLEIYDAATDGSRRLVSETEGTAFGSSFTPRHGTAVFAFSTARPNSSGLLQFTISDEPIRGARESGG